MIRTQPAARLDEFDKDEWRLIAARVRPDLTDDEFDILWAQFWIEKNAREKRKMLQ